jgi:predicted DNA-binding protein (UPF0251 family)
MADIEYIGGGYKRGRQKGCLNKAPLDPDKVLEIVRLREIDKLNWRQIGTKLGVSRQGPFLLYKRWRDWAQEQQQ